MNLGWNWNKVYILCNGSDKYLWNSRQWYTSYSCNQIRIIFPDLTFDSLFLYKISDSTFISLKDLNFFSKENKSTSLLYIKIYTTHISFNTKIKDGNNQENKGLVGAALCQLVKEFHRFYFIYKTKIIYTAVDLLTQYIVFFN